MIIRNKFNGYSGDGRRLYPGGGGGPTTSYTQTSNIPEYAQPYVERMMGATEKQVFTYDDKGENITGFKPYQSFSQAQEKKGGAAAGFSPETVAGFTPMQAQAMQGLQNYQLPGQTGAASGMAADLAGRALQAGQYTPGYSAQGFGNQYSGLSPYQTGRFGVQNVGVGTFTRPGTAEAYMSPYQQAVTDVEKREATRASDILKQQQQAQAVQQGAFGGGRQAIVEAERQRNLSQQLGDIQSRGQQAAFTQAQQQFNAENLQAGLQAQLANQQAAQQAQQAREQSRQFGYGQGMTSAQLRAQYGLAGQQLGEQSRQFAEQARQFGAGLGMQGIENARASAALLGNLGQQQYAQEMGLMGQQMDVGAKQQAYEQARLNQVIQDYATQQQYPFIQLGTLSNMLRGLPMQASTTQMYQAQPSLLQQGIGAAGAAANLYQAFKAEGGEVKEMASGGIASGVNPNKLPSMMEMLSDEQLKGKLNPQDTDPETLGIAQAEKQRRDHLRKSMAGGGIVAFKEGGIDQIKTPFPKNPDEEEPTVTTRPKAAAPKPAPVEKDSYEAEYKRAIAEPSPVAADVTKLRTMQGDIEKEIQGGVEGQLQRKQELYKKQGVDRAAMYAQERADQNKALEEAQGDAKKAEYLRWAQIFATFGSTPGPVLKAAVMSINNNIPDMLEDQKQARAIQRGIKKAIFELDKAEYLDKKGDVDAALQTDREAKGRLADLTLATSKLAAKDYEDRLRAKTEMAKQKISKESAKEVALINERSQLAGVALREKAEQRRYDESVRKQNEIDKKRADAHTKNARAEIANFYKQNKDALDMATRVLNAPNPSEDAKEMANKELTRLRSEEMKLRRDLAASYPDARQEELESPLSGAAPAAAGTTGVKFLGFEK